MKLYYDYENQRVFDALNDGVQIQGLTMVLRDQVDITLYVMKYDDATELNVLTDVPAGRALLFGLKGTTQAKLAGGYLAAQSIWTKTAVGTYEATLDLAVDELRTELSTATSVVLTGEFTLRDVNQKDHYSTQLSVAMLYDVNGGSEGATHGIYLGNIASVREEVIDGVTRVLIYRSDGYELACFPPREV